MDFLKNLGKRFYIIAGVVLALAVAIAFFVFRNQTRKAELREGLETTRVQRGDLVSIIGATGSVRARQSAVLVWRTTGTVEGVDVGLGDQVQEGEQLAVLEQTSLPQTIISSQAELVSAKRNLDTVLNSDLQAAQALKAVEDAEIALEEALNSNLELAQAEKAVADARKVLENSERQLYYNENPADENSIKKAEAEFYLAADALEEAREEYDKVDEKPKDDPARAAAQKALSEAQQAYDLAYWNLNSLREASNEIDQAVARANVNLAESQLAQAERELERARDGKSPGEIAILRAQLADAQREWQRLQNGVDPDDVRAAEARVAAAEAALDLAVLRAPFDGTITQVEVLPGDQVSQGTVAFRIDDLGRMYADIQVSEVDINKIQIGQPVTLTFDAILAEEYQGKVVDVSLAGNTVQGVVYFEVTVELEAFDPRVRPGMTVAANIVINELNNVLLVPNRAVRIKDGKRVVYVLRASGIEAVEIELGASSDTDSQVQGGDLRRGDEIILNPPTDFQSQGPPPFVEQ